MKDEYTLNRWEPKCFRQRGQQKQRWETGRCVASLSTWEKARVAAVSECGEDATR